MHIDRTFFSLFSVLKPKQITPMKGTFHKYSELAVLLSCCQLAFTANVGQEICITGVRTNLYHILIFTPFETILT